MAATSCIIFNETTGSNSKVRDDVTARASLAFQNLRAPVGYRAMFYLFYFKRPCRGKPNRVVVLATCGMTCGQVAPAAAWPTPVSIANRRSAYSAAPVSPTTHSKGALSLLARALAGP